MLKRGFSLVEMMIVMVIVAVILAATAPTITKKITREREQEQASVGSSIFEQYPQDEANAVDYFKGRNQIIYMDGRESGRIGIVEDGVNIPTSSVFFGNGTIGNAARNFVGIGFGIKNSLLSVAIGSKAETNQQNSIAIGYQANAGDPSKTGYSIAIGSSAKATGYNGICIGSNGVASTPGGGKGAEGEGSIVIGYNGTASNKNSISIGAGNRVTGEGSVAIGNGITVTSDKTIRLGNTDSTVYIPGNLVVDKYSILGASKDYGHTWIREEFVNRAFQRINEDAGSYLKAYGEYGESVTIMNKIYKANGDVGIAISSDRRLKNVGEKFNGGLEELSKLDFYNYTFKSDKNNTPQVGVIAQDLQKVFPNSVTSDSKGFLRIRWDEMFYAALNAIKELGAKFKELSESLNVIKNDTQELKTIVEKQQSIIDAQTKMLEEQQKQIDNLTKKVTKLERKNKKKLMED